MQKLKQSSGAAKYGILLFGALWTAISCCVEVPILIGSFGTFNLTEDNPMNLVGEMAFPLIFMSCFVGVGIVVMLFGLRPIIAGTRVSKPEVQISKTDLRSGEEFSLSYQQGFKSTVDVKKLAVQLVLRESATYRRGTDTVTVTHDHVIQNFEIGERRFESGETLNQNFRWAIPRGGMHSFEANRNRLRWLIKIKVEMNGWPDYDEEFMLRVLPEIA